MDTPETDKVFSDWGHIDLEFAKQLERERDEARREAEEWKNRALAEAMSIPTEWLTPLPWEDQ